MDGGEIIHPIRNYAINLDDLENVEGFNNSGRRDQLYCFQLNNRRVYVRKEIPIVRSNFEESLRSIKNKPFNFICDEDDKIIAIPTKYEWDIDIQINNTTFSRTYNTMRILNSGKILGSLVSIKPNDILVDNPIMKYYCLASQTNKEAYFEFHLEDNTIIHIPIGSTIIIEGIIVNSSVKKKEILPGLLISALIGLSGKFDFKIILMKEKENEYAIKFVTPGVTITPLQQAAIGLTYIKIHDFYYISRIRLTTRPVNDYEIKYL